MEDVVSEPIAGNETVEVESEKSYRCINYCIFYINLAVKITQLRNPINNRFAGLLVVLTDLTELIKAQRMLVWREVAKRIAHETWGRSVTDINAIIRSARTR